MHLLFDLDGTLTDSFPGISRCINHALTKLGRDPVPGTQFRGSMGRPLATIFGALLETTDSALIDRAVAAYRARFDTVGIFENSLYPGIDSALELFQQSGHSLSVVTIKPTMTARRVLSHFGIERRFGVVQGTETIEPISSKADLLRVALHGRDRAEAIMIGDRTDDITAARHIGVRSVAAGWGYGSASELEAAKPDFLAETISELVTWVQAAG